jgi:predicted GNAT superfamily acetyltransferase
MHPAHFTIRSAAGLDELQQCVDIQGAVWGYDDNDIVPRRMFLLAQKIGGQVIGAFHAAGAPEPGEGRMAGFAMALPAYRDGHAYLHSHMLAVLPEFRNSGLGRRLKLAQRDDAIARGIERMEWTYDPLEIKNGYLNLAKLGAISRRYESNFYGPTSSALQGGLPTDRLYAEWWLRSPHVQMVLAGEPLSQETTQRIVVPHSIAAWKQSTQLRGRAEELQRANRLAFEAAFRNNLIAAGYECDMEGNGIFLLAESGKCGIDFS